MFVERPNNSDPLMRVSEREVPTTPDGKSNKYLKITDLAKSRFFKTPEVEKKPLKEHKGTAIRDKSGVTGILRKTLTPSEMTESVDTHNVTNDSPLTFNVDQYLENRKEMKADLKELQSESAVVFEVEDKALLDVINPLMGKLEELYRKLDEEIENPKQFSKIALQVVVTMGQINNEINNYIDSKQILETTRDAVDTLNQVKQELLHPASKAVIILKNEKKKITDEKFAETIVRIEAQFSKLQNSMEKLVAAKERYAAHPEFAREIFKNVKVLQEKSRDVFLIGKTQILRDASVENETPLSSPLTENIVHSFTVIKKMGDVYMESLFFTPKQRLEYKMLSLEGMLPRRGDLLSPIHDILLGAKDLLLAFMNEKNSTNEMLDDEKIETFQSKLQELEKIAEDDPDIGAGKLDEPLSTNVKEWKVQQKAAKEATQLKILNPLVEAYAELKSINNKKAGKEITAARDARINDTARWGVSITRQLEIPAGPYSNKRSLIIDHELKALNAGYASSSFRGRDARKPLVQPNLQGVTIDHDVYYTSSATNVEFFQPDPVKRMEATLVQTAEILSKKIETKLASIPSDSMEGKSAEKPIKVDVSTTLLLSPDILREKLATSGSGLKSAIAMLAHHQIDASQNERGIMKESLAAWMAFDKDFIPPTEEDKTKEDKELIKTGQTFNFADTNGALMSLKAETNEQGERAEGKTSYVQFDISCYNVGVNKFTALFNIGFGLDLKKELGGQNLEDAVNAIGFQKDEKRVTIKLSQLDKLKFDALQNLPEESSQKKIANDIIKFIGQFDNPQVQLMSVLF